MKRIDLENGDYIIIANKAKKEEEYTDAELNELEIFSVGALFGILCGLVCLHNLLNTKKEPEKAK